MTGSGDMVGFSASFCNFGLRYKLIALIFLISAACLIGMSVMVFRTGLSVETDIQAIVPQNNDPAVKTANDALNERFGNMVVFAVSGINKEKLKQPIIELSRGLANHRLVKVRSSSESFASYQALAEAYHPFRFRLLSDADRELLVSGKQEVIVQSAWRKLLGFQPTNLVGSFSDDPLGVFENFFSTLPFMRSASGIDTEGFIQTGSDAQETGYAKAIVLELAGEALDMDIQGELVKHFNAVQQPIESRYPDIHIYRTGLVFHAEHAASKAKNEFTLISIASLLGIVALYLFCFSSLRPLFLSIASLVYGFSAATIACSFLFSKLHLFTLVFGASLIGVVIDYSLHYFAHSDSVISANGNRFATLQRIFPSIVMGLLTTTAGYTCLYQASLPGLREIATFCIVGLITAWLFVVSVYPWAASNKPSLFPGVIYSAANFPARIWAMIGIRNSQVFILCLFFSAIVLWFAVGRTQHDIRLLYDPPPNLIENDLKIRSLFSEQAANQYFLVTGVDQQQLLETEERLVRDLQNQVNNGVLDGYSAISSYVPSVATQEKNFRLLTNTLYSDGGPLDQFISQAGIESEVQEKFHQALRTKGLDNLVLQDFLTNAPDELQFLWLGEHDGVFYSIVTLSGIHTLGDFSGIADAHENIVFVNRVQSLSDLLKHQYWQAVVLLILAYVVIGLTVLLRYRRVGGLSIMLIPLLSTFSVLALFSVFSVPVGLFHILAMYLSLGLGIDYGIFLYDSADSDKTKVAVMLSALTSSLSFGLLSLSSTPMISAFGLTILLSGISSFLFAPVLVDCGRDLNIRCAKKVAAT